MRHLVRTLALFAAPARAVESPTVVTHATAHDRLPNTVADVQLGIESHRQTIAAVRNSLSVGSAQLMNYLRSEGADRIATQTVSVEPELDDPPRGRPAHVVGYTGRLAVTFCLASANLGTVLAEVLTHGANTIDNAAQHPRECEIDSALERLAAAATRLALSQAHAVADAAGLKACSPRQIAVNASDIMQPPQRVAFAPRVAAIAEPSAPITTAAGDTEISVSVTATVALVTP